MTVHAIQTHISFSQRPNGSYQPKASLPAGLVKSLCSFSGRRLPPPAPGIVLPITHIRWKLTLKYMTVNFEPRLLNSEMDNGRISENANVNHGVLIEIFRTEISSLSEQCTANWCIRCILEPKNRRLCLDCISLWTFCRKIIIAIWYLWGKKKC